MMNGWSYQRKALIGGCLADGVVCPKPRRAGLVHSKNDSLLFYCKQQTEAYDVESGSELLDIILMKGDHSSERSIFQVASSPPFFVGSPPDRASNPIIQDENFGNPNSKPLSPMLEASASNHRSGARTRVSFGSSSAPLRIEGFNCCKSCSISAVA